jgi:hypothetical protein
MKIRWVSSGVALIALIAGAAYSTAPQQPQERVIKRMPVEQNEPLAITDIKIDGRSVSFGQKFVADDDWMRTLVFSIKNISDKRILFVNLDLFFTRPPGSKDQMAMFNLLGYGNWALQRRPPTEEERLKGIAAGETVQVELSNQRFDDLKRFLTDVRYPNVTQVDVKLGVAIFEDDTMWSGEEFRRDPQNPSSWVNSRPNKSQRN